MILKLNYVVAVGGVYCMAHYNSVASLETEQDVLEEMHYFSFPN